MQNLFRTCLTLLFPVFALGCQATEVHTKQLGKATWRSDALPVDKSGGVISATVESPDDDALVVFLVEESAFERQSGDVVTPDSVARVRARGGQASVRFSGLAPGTYRICAFIDANEDGIMIEEWRSSSDSETAQFNKPSSGYASVEVRPNKLVSIDLIVR